jgi:AcrR family transcriptional regulator
MGPRAIRTTELILQTAKQVFLERGYGGTRIDNITEACGISRASFYTYFPSKRDVFLALGASTFKAVDRLINDFPATTGPELEEWVSRYMTMMDEHGAFVLAWGQAAHNDDELRTSGRDSQLREARKLGRAIRKLGDGDLDETATGLAILAMLDRFWYFWRVMGAPVDRDEVFATLSRAVSGMVRAPATTR